MTKGMPIEIVGSSIQIESAVVALVFAILSTAFITVSSVRKIIKLKPVQILRNL